MIGARAIALPGTAARAADEKARAFPGDAGWGRGQRAGRHGRTADFGDAPRIRGTRAVGAGRWPKPVPASSTFRWADASNWIPPSRCRSRFSRSTVPIRPCTSRAAGRSPTRMARGCRVTRSRIGRTLLRASKSAARNSPHRPRAPGCAPPSSTASRLPRRRRYAGERHAQSRRVCGVAPRLPARPQADGPGYPSHLGGNQGPRRSAPRPARTTDTTAIFEAGNPGPRRPRAGLDETAGVRTDLAPGVLAKLRRERPPFNVTPLDLLPAEAVAVLVLAKGGATLPRRDANDERRLRQDRAGPERVILSQDDVGGYGLQPGGRRRRTPSRAWQSD